MISLKGFHLFFIAVSILTCAGFGAWGIRDFAVSRNALHLTLSLASCAGGLWLCSYLVKTAAKFKRVGTHP